MESWTRGNILSDIVNFKKAIEYKLYTAEKRYVGLQLAHRSTIFLCHLDLEI